MSDGFKCTQHDCDSPPVFRFTWPGKDEAYTCAIHAFALNKTAAAIGLHLQLIQLTPEDYIKLMKP